MPYFQALNSSAVGLRTCHVLWQQEWPHPLALGRYHSECNSLSLPSHVILHHSARWQYTNDSFKTQKLL